MVHLHLGLPSRMRMNEEARSLSRTALCAIREGSGVLAFEPQNAPGVDHRHPAIVCASDIVDGIEFYHHSGGWPAFLPPTVRNRIGACVAPVLGDNIKVSLSVKEGQQTKTSVISSDTLRALQQPEEFSTSQPIELVGNIYAINAAEKTVKINTFPRRVSVAVGEFFSDVDANMRWKKVFVRGRPVDAKCKQLTDIELIRLANDAEETGVEIPSERERAAAFPVYQMAKERITEFAKLGRNWNSYDATPITERNADFALRFLADAIMVLNDHEIAVPQPFVVPTPTGGIQFEWENQGRALELEIDEHNRFNYLTIESNREREGLAARWHALRLVRWIASGEEA